MSDQDRPKPGLLACLGLPALIFVVGVIASVTVMVTGFLRADNTVDDFARIPSGQTATLELGEAGGYRVYFEHDSVVDDAYLDTTVTVEGPDGPVAVRPYATDLTYSMAGRSGRAVHTFDVAEPGDFQVSVESDRGGEFAIANENPLAMAGAALARSMVVGVLATVVALVLMLVLFGRRRRSKRRIGASGQPHGGGPAHPTPGPLVGGPAAGGFPAAPGPFGPPGSGGPFGSQAPTGQAGQFGSPGAFGPRTAPGQAGPQASPGPLAPPSAPSAPTMPSPDVTVVSAPDPHSGPGVPLAKAPPRSTPGSADPGAP